MRFFKSRFGSIYLFLLVFISLSFLTRALLAIKAWPDIDSSLPALIRVFITGTFFDLVTAFYFTCLPALILWLWPSCYLNSKFLKSLTLIVFGLSLFTLLFNCISEWMFWDEFGVRYNFIAVDYLIYTSEVLKNIQESYPIFTYLGVLGLMCLSLLYVLAPFLMKGLDFPGQRKLNLTYLCVFLMIPVFSFFCVDMARLDLLQNRYSNELAKNGIYSLFHEFRTNILDYNQFYLSREKDQVLDHLKVLLAGPNQEFVSKRKEEILRRLSFGEAGQPKNLIVILVESLSADFLARFGNQDKITPNLDQLISQSLFFSNLYATGNRTVRGLEATVLSIPPTPGQSIVRRPKNKGLFSAGSVMHQLGYDNKFIYGGFGYFDNMNEFMQNNHFTPIDRSDMTKDNQVSFGNAWGVCDEDLFQKSILEAEKSIQTGKPFFQVVLTTSNHRPYTYPNDSVVGIPSGSGRNGAVKYTDYALGKFLQKLREKPWFSDTIVAIIADHCAASAGKTDLPPSRYHIPLWIYQPKLIAPREINTLCSQIDLMPTLLALMKLPYQSRFFGQDILNLEHPRALIATYQKMGLLTKDSLLILSPKNGFKQMSFNAQEWKEAPVSEDLLMDAITYYQGASTLYMQDAYTDLIQGL